MVSIMIKNLKTLKIISFLILGILCSCTEYEEVISPESNVNDSNEEWHSATLHADIISNSLARSEDGSWQPDNGDLLCIQFVQQRGGTISGYATYDSSSERWNLQYRGTLDLNQTLKCEVKYFANANINLTTYIVNLDDKTPVFISEEGEYTAYDDNTIGLFAELKPYCFRMRFQGDSICDFEYRGPFIYDFYSLDYNILNASNSYVSPLIGKIHAGKDGFVTPYYYCMANKMRSLKIKLIDMVYKYKKDINCQEFAAEGQSNLILMPSIAPENWYVDDYREWGVSTLFVINQTSYNLSTHIISQLNSKVGILVNFSYIIKSLSWKDVVDSEFNLVVDSYDSNGDFISQNKFSITSLTPLTDESVIGFEKDAFIDIFEDGAESYDLYFETNGVAVTISDVKLSTF